MSEQVMQHGRQVREQRQRPGGQEGGGEPIGPVEGDVAEMQRPEAEVSSFAALRGFLRGSEGDHRSSAAVDPGTSMLGVIVVQKHPESAQDEGGSANDDEQDPQRSD